MPFRDRAAFMVLHKQVPIIESVTARSDITVKVGYHSHVLSEVPEDTDVFLVLTRQPRVPEIVAAGPYMFTIDLNGKITVEDRPKPNEHTESEAVDPKTGNVHLQVPIPATTKKQ